MQEEGLTMQVEHLVCGGGIVGILWALYLKRMSNSVAVFESYTDLRQELIPSGRSINLVLSRKALDAFEELGIKQQILKCTIPIQGQIIHCSNGSAVKLPYGLNEEDVSFQIPRNKLMQCLLDIAQCSDISVYFQCTLVDGNVDTNQYIFKAVDENQNEANAKVKAKYMYGTDGAGSKVRELILKKTNEESNVEWYDADYKQLFLPASFETKSYHFDHNWVHVWPRGGHMVMGHANAQGSFSLTIILPSKGPYSFEEISKSQQNILKYFEQSYPDLAQIIPNLPIQFAQNPVGYLGTIKCPVWHYKDKVVLIGDSAHTITPFLWQAVNIGMDDCLQLNKIINELGFTEEAFAKYFKQQKPKSDALSQMAVQHFEILSSLSNQDKFLKMKKLEKQIEKLYPNKFYSKFRMLNFQDKSYYQIKIQDAKYSKILNQIFEKNLNPTTLADYFNNFRH